MTDGKWSNPVFIDEKKKRHQEIIDKLDEILEILNKIH